ncbi:MAG: hypothetical protein ACOYOS_21480 [Syntrophales bacterium]
MILATEEDVREFSHGGHRDRKGLGENREDNARVILAQRIGIEKVTLNTHINYCQYLSEQTIQFFIEKQAIREFFKNAQPLKQRTATKLVEKKDNIAEITKQISELMEAEFVKFVIAEVERKQGRKKTKTRPAAVTLNKVPKQSADNDDEYGKEGQDDAEDQKDSTGKIIKMPEKAPGAKVNPTIDTVKSTVSSVLARLSTRLSEPATVDELEASIAKELEVLLAVMNDLQFLKGNSGRKVA